jgi:glucose 1-dehydrogenase
MLPSMRAVITGAASGIGRAVAERLAEQARARGEAASLLLVDVAADALERVAAEVGGHAFAYDLSRPDAGEAIAAATSQRLGPSLDALISNAGIGPAGPLVSLPFEDWERTFAVNVRATWLIARACHPLLKAARGALVATASIAAREPAPPIGAYAPSKAALVMLVRQLAYEWGPDGIRCNTVSPGTTHTGMTDATYSDPARRAERASHIPLRRVAEPGDIASVICFLASPDAGYVTGTDVLVDGGFGTSLLPAIRGLSPP